MANQFTTTTLSGTYFDDHSITDNYHQILFNSGRALQARELTQLQTLVYEEMGRFGKNIFKEGAAISGGGSNVNGAYQYVKIASTNSGGLFSAIPVGTIFKDPLTNISAQVLEVIEANGGTPAFEFDTLYVRYIDSGAGTVSSETITFSDGVTIYDQTGTGYELVTEDPNATGYGVKFSVAQGDFFVLGRFVHTEEQSIILSSYSQTGVNKTVGFKVVQEVVTINDTQALYDNTSGIVNTSSPGADRYRIRLVLTTQDQVTADDTFLWIATVENSKITEEIQVTDAYNKINDLLALRTKEESGDYIVSPFIINLSEGDVTDSSLDMIISDGTAYVNGYRVNKQSATRLSLPKPTKTELVENQAIPVYYGNYFICSGNRGIPDIDYSIVELYDGAGAGGVEIGQCRIRAVESFGDQFKVYVFDVVIDPTKSIRDAASIGTGATDYFNIVAEGSNVQLYDTTNNDLLFPTPRIRPSSFADVTIIGQVRQAKTASTSTINLDQLPVGSSYVESGSWIVGTALANVESGYVVTITNGGRDCSISSLDEASGNYEVLAYVSKTATVKPKTLVSSTATIAGSLVDSDSGLPYWTFAVPDIYEVDSVRSGNSAGIDIKSMFALDDGQRDNYYADGRLVLKNGHVDAGQIYVSFKHFTRGSGDFYASTSYPIDYKDIPDHALTDGSVINLRDYLDFRPDQNDRIGNNASYTNIVPLPRNGDNIVVDATYYLPRADKLILTPEGEFQILMGEQAENPQFKVTPENTMELYKIILNANTLDEDDLEVMPVEHRLYTMKDIAALEQKIDDLEAYTTLSLLELDQRLSPALDSDGNVRVEVGSIADDLGDQTMSDTNDPDFGAALDPESRLVRPSFTEKNLRLIVDTDLSSGIVKKGDNVYLQHDSAEWASQLLASRGVLVNPFGLIDNVGTLKISPNTDEWKESEALASKALAGSNKIEAVQAFLWNNHVWNWQGRNAEDIKLNYARLRSKSAKIRRAEWQRVTDAYATSKSTFKTEAQTGNYVSRVVATDTLRQVVGNHIVDIAVIPWIRSRKVYFKAQGLTPNTKFTPFFDGQDVSEWCRQESSFVQWSDRSEDVGNKYTQNTINAHPAGTSSLISDANGEVIGSFFIPNIQPEAVIERTTSKSKKWFKTRTNTSYSIRFRAGVREFKLLDINVNDWASAGSKAFAYYTVQGALPNTRSVTLATPMNGGRQQYSSKELKSIIDQIGVDNVSIVDPRLAGLYGPNETSLSAAALASIAGNKSMSKVISDYIDVNKNQFADVLDAKPVSIPMNPLAQTFFVDNQFGVTLTKLDLFFKAKPASSNLPVSIHIRPVVNGKPSLTEIVTDSHVYVNSADVVITADTEQLSTISANSTSFVFEEPVYLKPHTSYAIVITSQSTEYELYSAKTNEFVVGSSSRAITTQPAPGLLFLPQNGVNWLESKDQDIMYRLTRAKFGTSGGANGSLILRNADVPATLLADAPIRTTLSSPVVYVAHKGHGLFSGDTVQLDSCENVGGIVAATYLNGSHTVDSADIFGYTFTAGGSASATAVGGGINCLSLGNMPFSIVNPHIETIVPNYTSLSASAKWTSGRSISGSETRFVQDVEYKTIALKQNLEFTEMKTIYNTDTEDAELGAGESSVYFKIDMKSSTDYVSPIVDLQRSSLVLVDNLIDDESVTTYINPALASGAAINVRPAQYIMKPIVLEHNAVGIEVKSDVQLLPGSNVEMFYRIASADENIYDKAWVVKETISVDINAPSTSDFKELVWLPGDRGGTLPAFNQAQVMFTMSSNNGAIVPKIRDARAKFMAV